MPLHKTESTRMGTEDKAHGYCISSQVLMISLLDTEDMTHRY